MNSKALSDQRQIRVLIDARVDPGRHGGIETVVANLASVFRCELNRDISPVWLVTPRNKKWVESFIEKDWDIVVIDEIKLQQSIIYRALNYIKRVKFLDTLVIALRKSGMKKLSLPTINVDSHTLKLDLVHFATQDVFQTQMPNIYQPHDLQHEYFPDFFTGREIDTRRRFYKQAMNQSTFTILSSNSANNDFHLYYPEFKSRFGIVPQPAKSLNSKSVEQTKSLVELYGEYYLFPAAVWPHKNHSNLLEGFNLFLQKYPDRKLILCGPRTDSDKSLTKIIRELNIENHVVRLGYVNSELLKHLYQEAKAIVIPSLFEAGSFPIWEAFSYEKLVAVSNIEVLKSQAKDGAIYFNPTNSQDICAALQEIEEIFVNMKQHIYIQRSKLNYLKFSPCNTFLGYRFFYRRALGLPIDENDQKWLKYGVIF